MLVYPDPTKLSNILDVPTPTAVEFAIETLTEFTKWFVESPAYGIRSTFNLDPERYAWYVPIPGVPNDEKLPLFICP